MTQTNPIPGVGQPAQVSYQQPFNPYTPNTMPPGLGSNLPYTQPAFANPVPTGFPMGDQTQLQVPPMPSPMPSPITTGEQSYIENILSLNRGKIATVYMTFEHNSQWNAKIFKGVVETAGRDHVVISDPTSGIRYLLPMINFDYATFEEELEYHPSFAAGQPFPTPTR